MCLLKGLHKYSTNAKLEVSISCSSKAIAKAKVFLPYTEKQTDQKLDATGFHSGNNLFMIKLGLGMLYLIGSSFQKELTAIFVQSDGHNSRNKFGSQLP